MSPGEQHVAKSQVPGTPSIRVPSGQEVADLIKDVLLLVLAPTLFLPELSFNFQNGLADT